MVMPEQALVKQQNYEGYVLLVANVDAEYIKDVLSIAEDKGALSFTAVHGKGIHVLAKEAVFNVPVGTRRSFVLIVTKKELADSLQADLFDAVGLRTNAHGIVFQLPICSFYGVFGKIDCLGSSPEPCGDGGDS